jgi:hypothetical protein
MICPNCAGNNHPRSQKCEWCGQWFDPSTLKTTPKTTLVDAEIYWMNSDNTGDGMRWDAWTAQSDTGFQPYIEPGDFVTIVDGEYRSYESPIPAIGVGNFDSPISWMTKTLKTLEVEN